MQNFIFAKSSGYVTHGTDRPLWAFRENILTPNQVTIARTWLDAIDSATKEAEGGVSVVTYHLGRSY